jgi:hypothetical protein
LIEVAKLDSHALHGKGCFDMVVLVDDRAWFEDLAHLLGAASGAPDATRAASWHKVRISLNNEKGLELPTHIGVEADPCSYRIRYRDCKPQ